MADRHVACFPAVCQGKFLGQLLGDVAVCGLQVPGRGNCIQISFHQFPVVLDEGEEDVGELFLEKGNGLLHEFVRIHCVKYLFFRFPSGKIS